MSIIENKHIDKLLNIVKMLGIKAGVNPIIDGDVITHVKLEMTLKLDDIKKLVTLVYGNKENMK